MSAPSPPTPCPSRAVMRPPTHISLFFPMSSCPTRSGRAYTTAQKTGRRRSEISKMSPSRKARRSSSLPTVSLVAFSDCDRWRSPTSAPREFSCALSRNAGGNSVPPGALLGFVGKCTEMHLNDTVRLRPLLLLLGCTSLFTVLCAQVTQGHPTRHSRWRSSATKTRWNC